MNLIYNNKTPVGINYNNNEVETLNYNGEPVWENTPYEELEYIKSTGTQFIDTGISAGTNTSIEVDAKLNAINNRTTMMGNWGTRENDDLRWCVYFHNDNRLYFYISTSNYSWVWSSNAGNRMTYKIDHNKFYVNGNLYRDFTSRGNIDTQKNALIFTASSDGSDACYMTLYACKVWENDVLVRDFIPVRRKSDNEICLYDKLTEEFYTNRGTGSFSAGPEKKAKISDFKTLEYIQSTGTQFIDTGINPDSNTVIEIKFSWQGSNYGWGRLFGTSGDINFELAAKSNTTFRFGINGSGAYVPFNGDVIQTVKVTGTGKYYLDDVLKLDRNINQNFINFLYLLCIGNASNREKGKAKIYYCKIWNNDILIKNFIPVEKKSNNEIGLYNLVDNSFYTNQGTGEFTAGPEI